MIQVPTVLIVGAGASCELGFPSGEKLLQDIASALSFQSIRSDNEANHELLKAIRRLGQKPDGTFDGNRYVAAAGRLRDAARLARSIDNALDQNAHFDSVETVGKMAIAHQILRKEYDSKLKSRNHDASLVNLEDPRDTWLFHLGRMVTTNVRKPDAIRCFDKLSIITFNYDRSIEHYLPTVFQDCYGFNTAEARSIVSRLEIFHPYGSVGDLPWLNRGNVGIPYGEVRSLDTIYHSLRTFSEKLEETASLSQMRKKLSEAQHVVFLGFGFHPQNMELLTPRGNMNATRILGTIFNEPGPAREPIRDSILSLGAGGRLSASVEIQLVDSTCSVFLNDFARVLERP